MKGPGSYTNFSRGGTAPRVSLPSACVADSRSEVEMDHLIWLKLITINNYNDNNGPSHFRLWGIEPPLRSTLAAVQVSGRVHGESSHNLGIEA